MTQVREVVVARAEPRLVYLSDGVEAGEMIVTTNLEAPIPGTRLIISGEQPRNVNESSTAQDDTNAAEDPS